jgi:hypothetical protein
MWFWHPHPDSLPHQQLYTYYPFNLHGILYSQYNSNTHPHWYQQETDNPNMATMAMAVFVTKQQPTVNIIM